MNGSHVVIMLENNCGINATVNSYLDVDTIFTITPTQISCDQLHNEALSGDKFGSAQIDASTFNAATDFITFRGPAGKSVGISHFANKTLIHLAFLTRAG